MAKLWHIFRHSILLDWGMVRVRVRVKGGPFYTVYDRCNISRLYVKYGQIMAYIAP